MDKVGIITTSHAINYGAVLQAYSLKIAVEEVTGKKTEIINYCGDEWISGRKIYRKDFNLKNAVINIVSFFRFRYRKKREELFFKFDIFKKEFLLTSGELLTTTEELTTLDSYDTLICGSDQLWNLNLFNDENYFLTFAKSGVEKVAYSVSISEGMSNDQMNTIAERARDFKAISVREEDDAERLSKVMGRTIYNIVDPVFLHSAVEWNQLLSIDNSASEDYLFVFLISHADCDQKYIDRVKGESRVVVLNLHPIDYVKGDEMLRCCSPNEFVKLISSAKAVVTDSFHCTAFSIIFHKQFYNIRRSSRNNRIENLYRKFGIDSRFITDNDIPHNTIDYFDVDAAIQHESLKGKKYIKDSIGDRE